MSRQRELMQLRAKRRYQKKQKSAERNLVKNTGIIEREEAKKAAGQKYDADALDMASSLSGLNKKQIQKADKSVGTVKNEIAANKKANMTMEEKRQSYGDNTGSQSVMNAQGASTFKDSTAQKVSRVTGKPQVSAQSAIARNVQQLGNAPTRADYTNEDGVFDQAGYIRGLENYGRAKQQTAEENRFTAQTEARNQQQLVSDLMIDEDDLMSDEERLAKFEETELANSINEMFDARVARQQDANKEAQDEYQEDIEEARSRLQDDIRTARHMGRSQAYIDGIVAKGEEGIAGMEDDLRDLIESGNLTIEEIEASRDYAYNTDLQDFVDNQRAEQQARLTQEQQYAMNQIEAFIENGVLLNMDTSALMQLAETSQGAYKFSTLLAIKETQKQANEIIPEAKLDDLLARYMDGDVTMSEAKAVQEYQKSMIEQEKLLKELTQPEDRSDFQFKTNDGRAFVFDPETGAYSEIEAQSEVPSEVQQRGMFGGAGGVVTSFGSKYWSAGLDVLLDGGKGASVPSPFAGTVLSLGDDPNGFGKYVEVEMDNGEVIRMSHLDSYGDIQEGQTIAAGQMIGTQGNTGNVYSTTGGDGTHVDYTIFKDRNNRNKAGALTAQEVAQRMNMEQRMTGLSPEHENAALRFAKGEIDRNTVKDAYGDAADDILKQGVELIGQRSLQGESLNTYFGLLDYFPTRLVDNVAEAERLAELVRQNPNKKPMDILTMRYFPNDNATDDQKALLTSLSASALGHGVEPKQYAVAISNNMPIPAVNIIETKAVQSLDNYNAPIVENLIKMMDEANNVVTGNEDKINNALSSIADEINDAGDDTGKVQGLLTKAFRGVGFNDTEAQRLMTMFSFINAPTRLKISGQAVSESEFKNIADMMFDITDPQENLAAKIQTMRDLSIQELNAVRSGVGLPEIEMQDLYSPMGKVNAHIRRGGASSGQSQSLIDLSGIDDPYLNPAPQSQNNSYNF